MPWKLKLTPENVPVIKDGMPVYVDPAGLDAVFDPNSLHGKLLEANAEAKERRERITSLQSKLAIFGENEDLAAYKTQADEALKVVKNYKDHELVQAGKVEAVKMELKRAADDNEKRLKDQFTTREKELTGVTERKDQQIRRLIVSNLFASSRYFSGAEPLTTLPPDVAEAKFGDRFQVREDKATGGLTCVALDARGEPMLSRERIGEIASFEEATGIILDGYQYKQQIMRQSSGSGSTGGTGGFASQTPVARLREELKKAVTERNAIKMISLTRQIEEAEKR